ncbi:MAG: DUF2490 domain-containing protein [Chitinophagaceae bacterium]|nr:DUF2490 domain-containing protein [Chitinophagaceae bacterium]
MKNIPVILFLILKCTAHAQRPSTGAWFTANVPVKIKGKWQMHNDGSYRTLGNRTAASQYLYRTGIRYQVNTSLSATAGVAFFFTRTSFDKGNPEFGREFRTWQELLYQKQISPGLQWHNRLRTEQRFFEETKRRDAFTAHRFRLRSALICKVAKNWSVNVSEEYFRQLAHREFSFDQNRVIATAIYQLNKTTQLQGGYMWLLWPQSSSQHLLTFTFQKTISLHGTGN